MFSSDQIHDDPSTSDASDFASAYDASSEDETSRVDVEVSPASLTPGKVWVTERPDDDTSSSSSVASGDSSHSLVAGDGASADAEVEDPAKPRTADVLDPDSAQRPEAVGIDRRFVLAGLAFVGTVFCLILLVFSGGGDDDTALAQTPPPTTPPGAYIDEQTADYYGEEALDPAAPVAATGTDPYAADPYAGTYNGAPNDYATTQAYAAPPSSYGAYDSGERGTVSGSQPQAPAQSAFDRAVLSPLLIGSASGSARPRAEPQGPPSDLTADQVQELAFMREVAGLFPGSPPPSYGPASGGGAQPASAAMAATMPGLTQSEAAAAQGRAPQGGGSKPGHSTRQAFAERTSQTGRAPTYDVAVRPAASRALTLQAGSVVPAALVTGMNSDLPGTVIAQVTRNVYDSVAQRDVLIPAGTRLVGEYDDQIAYGQGRALVAWSRMLFPDGSSIDLPGLPGVDLQGYAGLADRVDRHYGRVFGAAVMLAAVGVGVELASPQRGAFDVGQSPQDVASRQVAIELGRVATEVVKRELDVEPTIRIAPGYRFYVLLARDLTFAGPYRPRPDVGRFPRR